MGRLANGLDWTEEGSGVGRRAISASVELRPDSEMRIREQSSTPVATDGADDDPPTCRFFRSSSAPPPARRDTTDALSARGLARLSALADWLDGEEPSGVVVSLVRAFLRDVKDVGYAMDALMETATVTSDARSASELAGAVRSVAAAIGLWRSNLVEHVDDLALNSYRSLAGWSSLPEYSSAYSLAIVEPALAEAEAWATASRPRGAARDTEGSEDVELGVADHVRVVRGAVRRLNSALRAAITPSESAAERGAFERALAAAW